MIAAAAVRRFAIAQDQLPGSETVCLQHVSHCEHLVPAGRMQQTKYMQGGCLGIQLHMLVVHRPGRQQMNKL